MRVYAFVLPDSLDEKDLSTCIFNMKFRGDEGEILIDMINKPGRFTREIVKVHEMGSFYGPRTKNVPSNEEVI